MNRLEAIKERNQRHQELRERGRKSVGDPLSISNRELSTALFEIKHINDQTPEDIKYLLSKLEIAEKALEKMHHILASIDEKPDSMGKKSDAFFFIRTTLEKLRE